MAKDQKKIRPKAITPKGFRDYFGSDVTERNQMLQKIAEIYDSDGFEALEGSAVETVAVSYTHLTLPTIYSV